ncbi:ABC transporter ATP-binding protein [Microbacterium paraoxydans]|uniref:ABC transporter ATP-binding protein n=1 Tax=Microbacterium paraoxydans TaxID=199592 RepID=UPI002F261357
MTDLLTPAAVADAHDDPTPPALRITDLVVEFGEGDHATRVVDGVSLELRAGRTFALVGESGSGKSITAASVLGLLPHDARIRSGSIAVGGAELAGAGEARLRRFRGSQVGMIFQNPLASLDPSFRIGSQLREIIAHHRPDTRRPQQDELARTWLQNVGIADAERVLRSYPHELSGGMRQRVMIALASLSQPAVLIADEPTTALDAVIQKQILDLLQTVVRESGGALLLITHDFGVVSYVADDIAVMKDGRIVETGERRAVLRDPQHDYTRTLIAAVPGIGARFPLEQAGLPVRLRTRTGTAPDPGTATAPRDVAPEARTWSTAPTLLRVNDVSREFHVGGIGTGIPRRSFSAVDEVSFEVARGEVFGLIGASGSGKSTLARVIGGLLPATAGTVEFDGVDLAAASPSRVRGLRPRFQFLFQDATSSLNPRIAVGEQIARPVRRFGKAHTAAEARSTVARVLDLVGLPSDHARRYPHELSGGQRQRIGIARALALEPDLLILDEPTSALDVSTQATIIDLLLDLREELDLTYLFIGHNLSIIEFVCDRIGVLDAGRLVDLFPARELFSEERDATTRTLLSAILPVE